MITVILAVPDLGQEADLVVGAQAAGFRIVRRCVDAIDLFAAAAADPEPAIIVSAGLPRLGADAIDRMSASSRRRIVGIAACEGDEIRLQDLGVGTVVRSGPVAAASWRTLAAALSRTSQTADIPEGAPGVWATGCWDEAEAVEPGPAPDSDRLGRIVAVWGPMGAPGRTTVALGISEALADSGHRSCIVDADTYGPSVTMALGVVEDASGLVVACRHADNGSLTPSTLVGASRQVRGDLHVLGGLGMPERWPDLRPGALDQVWQACRRSFDVTVVDVGFCLEDEEGAGGPATPWSRRRNAAALSALSVADHLIAVADSSSLGAARLAGAWPDVVTATPGATRTVVQNRVRGRRRERQQAWSDGVRDAGVAVAVHRVPADPRALEACWERGRTLAEGARRSPVRRSFAALAGAVVSG